MDVLKTQIVEFEKLISVSDKSNSNISQQPIGWHLQHCLLIINNVCTYIQKSNPKDYKSSFKLKKIIFFTLKKIPRGKNNAPDKVNPKIFDKDTLIKSIANANEKINELKTITANHYFTHHLLGSLKLKKAIQFLEIHNQHHLKIIKDILKK